MHDHDGFQEHHSQRLARIEELLLALAAEVGTLVRQGRHLMNGLTNLQTAVAALETFAGAITQELSDLTAAVRGAQTGDSDDAVNTLAQRVQASISRMQQAATDASSVLGPSGGATGATGATGDTGGSTGDTGATGDTGPAF